MVLSSPEPVLRSIHLTRSTHPRHTIDREPTNRHATTNHLPRLTETIYNRSMSRASSLYRLQQLDLELDHSRPRIEEIKAILEDDREIVRHRQALSEAEEKLKTARKANSKADHAVSSQRSKIERTEKTLYGGTVRNPKELQDRQQEAESLKRFLGTLEDRLIEAMIALEEAQFQRDTADETLGAALKSRDAQHEDLNQERDQLMAAITRMEAEREAALVDVDRQDLNLYDELRKQAGSIAIALVQEGNCSACGLGLAQSIQQSIRSGNELVRCGQCRRILYAG